MADSNEVVKFTLDLDVKDFTEGVLKAKGEIQKLGSKENLIELIEGLTHVTVGLAAVGLAAFTVKEALDLTKEAEKINRINDLFETLTKSAGISSETLKKGLEEASKGLIDNTDLLDEANRAIVTMGGSAAKLPELLELARKATTVYGGDFKQNFENITRAIEMGNTRMLKHMGIIVDAQKATEDYAKAQGLAADELTQFGKQQAILEAVLAQGQTRFKGVKEDLNNATNTMQALKVTWNELAETVALAFERMFGPAVRAGLQMFKNALQGVQYAMKATFGTDAEKAEIRVASLTKQIEFWNKEIERLQELQAKDVRFKSTEKQAELNASMDSYRARIAAATAEIGKLKGAEESRKPAESKGASGESAAVQNQISDHDAMVKNELKFREEMLKIKKQYLLAEQQDVQTLDDIEKAIKDEKILREQEHQLKLDQIREEFKNKETQRDQAVAMEKLRFETQERAAAQATSTQRQKLLDVYEKKAKSTFDGIDRAFKKHTKLANAEQADFGKKGEQVYMSFQKHGVQAFEGIGEALAQHKSIAEATSEAMKKLFMNMLADRAEAEGSVLIASSIWPPNPIGLAAGGGLLALAGFLRGLAGGGGSNVSGVAGVSGGGGTTQAQTQADIQPLSQSSGATNAVNQEDNAATLASMQAGKGKHVAINIAGNYFDTESTRRQLMDLVRAETDATDFTYVKIGHN